MFAFFRKIRKSLLSKQNVSKYLLYAIGEILLVVLGILIALQINNSNEQHKRDQTTLRYMQALIQEIGNNLDLLNYSLSNVKMDMTKSALALEKINGPNVGAIPDSALYKIIGNATDPPFTSPMEQSVYRDLINSGVMENIKDQEIKNSIFKMENQIQQYDKYVESAEMTFKSLIMEYQIQNFVISKNRDSLGHVALPRLNFDINKQAYLNNAVFANQLQGKLLLYNNLARHIERMKLKFSDVLSQLTNVYTDHD
jgi:hypothetical protein